MLGAGIVIIQLSTRKAVVGWGGEGRWFLLKGKKDESEWLVTTRQL